METTEDTQTNNQPMMDEAPEPEKKAPPTSILVGLAPETVNLVPHMTAAELEECGNKVVKRFERDWNSSKKFRKRRASILKLFLGDLPPSDDVDAFAHAQIHYPIVAKAVQRIRSRISDQQFPSDGQFFGCYPTDALDQDRADRVAKHLNWQINHQIENYVPNHQALMTQWLLYGSAFSYVCWDSERNRPRHIALATEDVVLAYKRKSTDYSLADVPRITRILRLYRHELEEMEASGYYTGIDTLFDEDETTKQSFGDEKQEDNVVQDVIDKDSGVKRPIEDGEDAPRVLLEQHCWYKFTGEKRQKPVVITVDKQTKKVLCVKLREDEDPLDRARYNREEEANRLMYEAAIARWTEDMAMYEQMVPAIPAPTTPDMTAPPVPGETDVTAPPVPAEGMTPAVPAALPEPPPMPEPPDPPRPVKMVPIHFFTHYICIPNPEGVYGFGIGSMLEGNNIAADTMASQVIDAATLANTKGGLISRQMQATKGDLRYRPGEFIEVEAVGQKLSDMVQILEFNGPDATMGQLIRDQKEEAEALSGANEILSGEVGGSNETATTTQIRIGEAMRAIAILSKEYTRSRTSEGQKIARLNSVHLGDDEYFTVVDPYKQVPPVGASPPPTPPAGGIAPQPAAPMGAPQGDTTYTPPPGSPEVTRTAIARQDYLKDVDVMVTADPQMASRGQKIAEAQALLQTFAEVPFLASQPLLMAAAAKKYLKALDDPMMISALDASLQMTMSMMMPQVPGGGPPQSQDQGPGGPPQPESAGPTASGSDTQPANSAVMS